MTFKVFLVSQTETRQRRVSQQDRDDERDPIFRRESGPEQPTPVPIEAHAQPAVHWPRVFPGL